MELYTCPFPPTLFRATDNGLATDHNRHTEAAARIYINNAAAVSHKIVVVRLLSNDSLLWVNFKLVV